MGTVYIRGKCSRRETNNLETTWTGVWMASVGVFICTLHCRAQCETVLKCSLSRARFIVSQILFPVHRIKPLSRTKRLNHITPVLHFSDNRKNYRNKEHARPSAAFIFKTSSIKSSKPWDIVGDVLGSTDAQYPQTHGSFPSELRLGMQEACAPLKVCGVPRPSLSSPLW
jgi:hypothetical protein